MNVGVFTSQSPLESTSTLAIHGRLIRELTSWAGVDRATAVTDPVVESNMCVHVMLSVSAVIQRMTESEIVSLAVINSS